MDSSSAFPFFLYHLLDLLYERYIETDGEGAVVRPYVWIALMLLGPLFTSLLTQWYVFTATGNAVRIRAIVTITLSIACIIHSNPNLGPRRRCPI